MKELKIDDKIIKIEYDQKWGNLFFKVYKEGQSEPWYRKSVSLRGISSEDEVWETDAYKETLKSMKQNILPLDPDHLDYSRIEDYGIANGWSSSDIHQRITKYSEDLKKNPYLCVYFWEVNLGRCYTKYVNYTYGYQYRCNSSD